MDLFSICVGLLLLLVSNVSVLAFTLALSPLLVPAYMVHGEKLFVDESDYKENPEKIWFYDAMFKGIVKLCYWLFCPVWFLPKIIYDSCTSRTSDLHQLPVTVKTVTQQVSQGTMHQTVTSQPRIDPELTWKIISLNNSHQPSDDPQSKTLECMICFTSVFNPCGHSCCNQCASHMNHCHTCRSSISTKIRVY